MGQAHRHLGRPRGVPPVLSQYTRTGRNAKPAHIKTENPNHHLQKLGECWWLRIRRRKTDILHNLGKDLDTARRHRDEMLAAYDAGQPIPHLANK